MSSSENPCGTAALSVLELTTYFAWDLYDYVTGYENVGSYMTKYHWWEENGSINTPSVVIFCPRWRQYKNDNPFCGRAYFMPGREQIHSVPVA